ncbi:MAG: hypothetical protein HF978_04990 [Desulfobacteraceae bacterium]|nr:PD40 domain-containing protein [Desulfobacteraceae bacterium]MBC2754886.1 hypothetical protein [Desulfobacteraceae bacterium]
MKYRLLVFTVIIAGILLSHCSFSSNNYWDSHTSRPGRHPGKVEKLVSGILSCKQDHEIPSDISISYPYDQAVFPPEIAAPAFTWADKNPESNQWLITVQLKDRRPIYALTEEKKWMPQKDIWEIIKVNSVDQPAQITMSGLKNDSSCQILSKGETHLYTSTDRVDAAVLFRQVPLPFETGEKYIRKLKWRLGDIASYDPPPVVMQNMPVCASCHLFSADGKKLSMEMNYKNDSGSQFITDVKENIELTQPDFISWNDFPKPELLPPSRGVFGKMSPTGRYIVSTVNEISYMALTNDPAFSQLFFPTYGILAFYDVQKQAFNPLPGADDDDYIQTDPGWAPNENYIVFARAQTKNAYHEDIGNITTRIENAGIEELNKKFPICFDLYRIPFNNGSGGTPEPMKGACRNGMSNYFPRYSPDGKWIVFTQSKSGIMLQPDSELFIIPAQGGTARKMRCNREVFNSWHSWSPNSRWLLFSSKANTMYTEIFMTHVDKNGTDSPPVLLSRFSDEDYAANVPEFAPIQAKDIKRIRIKE